MVALRTTHLALLDLKGVVKTYGGGGGNATVCRFGENPDLRG